MKLSRLTFWLFKSWQFLDKAREARRCLGRESPFLRTLVAMAKNFRRTWRTLLRRELEAEPA